MADYTVLSRNINLMWSIRIRYGRIRCLRDEPLTSIQTVLSRKSHDGE